MQLKLFRHLWGVTDPLSVALPRFKSKGYLGIEFFPLGVEASTSEMRDHLIDHDFACVMQIITSGSKVREHIDSLKHQWETGSVLQPQLVNCQSGMDAFSAAEAEQFFSEVLDFSEQTGTCFVHETHRGKILCNPWRTCELLERFEQLKLCADFSHFVNVCERIPDDLAEQFRFIAERSLHVHTRIGYEQGPQVPDPRAPEFKTHLEAHERWWQMIWDSQQESGLSDLSMTPEFGPPPYLHTLPYTEHPVVELETVCDWMAQRNRAQFA